MNVDKVHIGNVYLTTPNDEPDFYIVGAEGEDVCVPGLSAEQLENEVDTVLSGLRHTIEQRRYERLTKND